MNFPCGPLDSIQLIALILFILLIFQSLLGIGLGIGFLLQPPLYGTIIDLNSAFNRQAYFSIYAPHILLIIGSGIVIIPILFGVLGILRRRWRYLIISLALLALYISILSAAAACGFANYDRLRPTLETDVSQTSVSIWSSVRATYNCTGTNCIVALENAMYSNKQRIGIISVVFLVLPLLAILIIMLQMRRDILYFK
ncbi:unnamed protein product [Rotaria magnacalcarata]|uniref:Tetraspanin n=2 Tax=Rotaria magnacalcarata TaxID=392030 RepID=A0A819HAF5_9BILA|nr:unnamed protein product [Rotaria magnacalcarata]CAF2077981.1 unnamed protein product [Rotaria magnacalcarata]CAF2125261.1 unnamed protein product [Rotaria magnacalcarata]CAF3800953.1 unnamed protein product [Rotaria magnacalcarata]CAF3894465.1 unnamed protein product [Rotaria magnacalcarata]